MNFALQDQQGNQLGFLLMVADEENNQSGSCLIRHLAENETFASSRYGQLLEQTQERGELYWHFDGRRTLIQNLDNEVVGSITESILTIDGVQFILVDLTGNI